MPADRQRLFFALWPPEPVRQQISAMTAVRVAGGKPVSPANYHLTLAFLGSVPVAKVSALIDAAQSLRFAPFTLRLDRSGYWAGPQIAVLQPAMCPDGLARLVAMLRVALEPLGFAADERSFKPHVTLARKVEGARDGLPDEPVEWQVDEFVLARSETRPDGAVYSLLEHFPAAL